MAEISTAPSNADITPTQQNGGGDRGLDSPVRSLTRTQCTTDQNGNNIGIALPNETGAVGNIRRNPETGQLYDVGGLLAPTSAGIGTNDDNPAPLSISARDPFGFEDPGRTASIESRTSNVNAVTGSINPNSRAPIYPQSNVLDKFSSYTYQISVYLMTPQQYQQLVKSNQKSISGYNLLFQSGGAPTNTTGFMGALNVSNQTSTEPTSAQSQFNASNSNNGGNAGRNPAFPLDFYIDSVTLENLIQGKGTGTAHNANALKFTVIEPVGITLIDRLYQAVQDAAPTNGANKVNYQAAQYLMVIRWFGYDQNGNIISGSPNNSDPRAAVEKFIPFVIAKINWRVSAKATEYEFECTPIGQIVATGTRRGVVPYDIQLNQGTVGKLLAGDLAYVNSAAPADNPGAATTADSRNSGAANDPRRIDRPTQFAPPKANAAGTSKPVVRAGLMTAMNEFVQGLTTGKNPVYEFADQYEIVFANGAEDIRDASIVPQETKKEAKLTPMAQPSTENAQNLDPATQGKDKSIFTKTIYAGKPIVQVIDEVIRNSSYITNQALTLYDDDDERANDSRRQKPVDWYTINFEAVPIGNQPDSRRNDYAYKIRYIISKYKIDHYDSKYFPLGTFRGVHKSYPWIFTGLNTAILDYSETLNTNYNLLVSGSDPSNSNAEIERRKRAFSMREQYFYTYGPRSAETSQGTRYKYNEVSANLADSLYASADLAETKLRIIGDPAWIQQGSLAGNVSAEVDVPQSFLPDGTINFANEQILFEVNWARPTDYNISTGIADPASAGPPVSRVYVARKVTSEFKQGKFEQVIEGLLFSIPKPDGTNKAPGAVMPNQSLPSNDSAPTAADPRRLAKSAAGTGATSTQTVPEPPTNLPVNIQQTNTSTLPVTTNDTVRPAPPPAPSTSGSGENLGLEGIAQAGRFRRNLETGELYNPGPGGIITTPQTQSWEP